MKVFVLFLFICSSLASRLVTVDDVENLFKKYMLKDLSYADADVFQQVIEILHRPEYLTTETVNNIYREVRTTFDCIICRSVISAAYDSMKAGQSEQEIGSLVTSLCTTLGIQSYAVCNGAIDLNLPIIYHIMTTVPEATPAAFCGLALQNSHNPNSCPFEDDRFEWVVDLPPKPAQPTTLQKATETPYTVALMTDFHIDPLYEANGVADCDAPSCCRIGQTPRQSFTFKYDDENVAARSLVTQNGSLKLDLDQATKLKEMRSAKQTRFPSARQSPPAGYWGDFRNCDTPIWAFDDAIDRIVETHKNIDAVYYIGDTIDHFAWETTYELINEVNNYAINKLKKSFGEHVPIIPVIGNHESQPTNQFAPATVTGKINTTWLYEALIDKWGSFIPEDQKQVFLERGEFSALIKPGLRVITINNNVAYKYNWWLLYDPTDAKKHLDWLIDELYKAEQAGESVHILAHIPPGVHDLTHTWTREYNKIVNRFSSTIKAEFNGHTHSDEFKIFYDNEGTPTNVAWGAGSVTSYTFYNLNYKIVTFDGNYEPARIQNYVYNLTEANLTPNRRPHWFQLYDMKNTFQLQNLTASSMNDLVQRMVTTEKQLLDIYAAFFYKLSDIRWSGCNNDCKLDMLCKIVVTVLWDRTKCDELIRIYNESG